MASSKLHKPPMRRPLCRPSERRFRRRTEAQPQPVLKAPHYANGGSLQAGPAGTLHAQRRTSLARVPLCVHPVLL